MACMFWFHLTFVKYFSKPWQTFNSFFYFSTNVCTHTNQIMSEGWSYTSCLCKGYDHGEAKASWKQSLHCLSSISSLLCKAVFCTTEFNTSPVSTSQRTKSLSVMSWSFGLQFLLLKLICFLICKFQNGIDASANFPLIIELIFDILNNLSCIVLYLFISQNSIYRNVFNGCRNSQ